MVYRGKPSAGCEACRKAKKRCGLEQPACARCVKLKKICYGYRDTTALQIQDESESVRQKANRHHRARTPASAPRNSSGSGTKIENGIATPRTNDVSTPYSEPSTPSEEVNDEYGQLMIFDDLDEPDETLEWNGESGLIVANTLKPSADDVAITYFFNHFTAASGHWTYLREMARSSRMEPVVDFAVRACGMAALNNVQGISMGREYSRMFYGEALGLLNSALRDSKRSKNDESLLAVAMLGYYENLTCDSRQSIQSWKAHISGAAQLLKLRGKSQFDSNIGRALYRETRAQVLIHCIWDDVPPPAFMWDLERELTSVTSPDDPLYPVDGFTMTCYNFADIRARMRLQTITDRDAMDKMSEIEMQMVQWSIDIMNNYPLWRYHEVEVSDSPHVWNNLVHSYSYHPAASSWNTYRSMRIMVTRVQEMLYRRLTPALKQDDAQIAYFRSVRRQMTDEICYGIPTQLGHASPAPNSPCILITAYSSVWPLFFAGTCTLERVGIDYFTNGAPSITSAASTQTSWIIRRMDFISQHVGLRWADGVSAILKGDFDMHGDIVETEDQDFIRLYWRRKSKREKQAKQLNGPPGEPGANAPAWVKKIQQSGRGARKLIEPDTAQSDEKDQPREEFGPIWLGRAAGASQGPYPKHRELDA